MDSRPYHGQIQCQGRYASGPRSGQACSNKAYFDLNHSYRCGVHGKGGVPLPKNPQARQIQAQARESYIEECEAARDENARLNQPGCIQMDRMGMRKALPDHPGFFRIFPNFKHGGRRDGLGVPLLSPMSLGPVDHGMPGLPPARSIENYHQGAKMYPGEVIDGVVTLDAQASRARLYLDPVPYRHKYKVPYFTGIPGMTNPLFSLHYTSTGEERRYTYLQSRYLYCHWYQRLAEQQPDLGLLRDLLAQGYNLVILGYDGFQIDASETVDELADQLWSRYLDTSRPFGHEAVLVSMLALPDPDMYPWNRYRHQHPDLYDDVVD